MARTTPGLAIRVRTGSCGSASPRAVERSGFPCVSIPYRAQSVARSREVCPGRTGCTCRTGRAATHDHLQCSRSSPATARSSNPCSDRGRPSAARVLLVRVVVAGNDPRSGDDGSTSESSLIDSVAGVEVSRVAIYNLYWHTYGGGEQVSGGFAEHLARSHDVTLLGPVAPDVEAGRLRLGVDLSNCRHVSVMGDDEASEASEDFDVFVNGTYRSNARNRSRVGLYYVHFPEPPPTPRDRVRSSVSRVGLRCVTPFVKGWDGDDTLHRIKRGLEKRRRDLSWVESYTRFLANSEYTARWVRELWGASGDVVYPAVRPVVSDVPNADKGPLIASLGRFFDPSLGHCKKQRDMLEAYTRLHQAGRTNVGSETWRLALVGGADAASREYTLSVRRAAVNLPVDVLINKPRSVVEDTLRSASIYWHGTGFGEDVHRHPERFEHFGIAVVEAMLAGAVPVVFGEAGPAEIVRHGVDGYHWRSLDELADRTIELMNDGEKRRVMSESAVARAREFSIERFRSAIDALL
ncbi:MAG: hypothetical protein B7C54_01680 [Acidimicrobiales bacterium mtb01]|nr:glycosyltransferase family 4 protein [Actinomycetota bacterium]TEX47950.1 MAG: hypothetical protein B7C54_01680 [Acidimicrobiales bacterium mtb01]